MGFQEIRRDGLQNMYKVKSVKVNQSPMTTTDTSKLKAEEISQITLTI